MTIYRNLLATFVLLAAVILLGVAGYTFIEGWSAFDSLYMTVITIATVGYGETHPLSDQGRLFTIALILCGSGVMVYGISVVTAFIVEGDLSDALRRRKMNRRIDALEGHVIICGDSTTGKYAIEEMLQMKKDFVVIDRDPAKTAALRDREILCVEGDATSDAVLRAAGIGRARGLITVLHSDAENLFVVVTAKDLNPALRIISKAVDEESHHKLRKVGADSVVLPDHIGGLRMVSEMIRPQVVTFLDVMLRSRDRTIRVEEVTIGANSPAVGKTLGETSAGSTEGASLVALVRADSESYLFNPPAKMQLAAGDTLIYVGAVDRIQVVSRELNGAVS